MTIYDLPVIPICEKSSNDFWKIREVSVMRDVALRNLKNELCKCFSDSLDAHYHATDCEFHKRLRLPPTQSKNRRKTDRRKIMKGFSLFSLLMALAIIGILGTFAIAMYGKPGLNCDDPNARPGYLVRAKIAAITADIGAMNIELFRFELSHNRFPDYLSELKGVNLIDPWGNPYQYLNFNDADGAGKMRKDHNLHKVNLYFDLYSMGPDGITATPFTSTAGQDDIVIAANGSYIGPACHYQGSGK